MQGVTRKRRLGSAALEPAVELESIRSRRQRSSHFQPHQTEDIRRVQQRLLDRFRLSVLTLEQLQDFPFLRQGRQNCCTVVSMNHLAFVLNGAYDPKWKDAYKRLRKQVAAIDSLSTMYELYGRMLVPVLKVVDLRQLGYAERLERLRTTLLEQFETHGRPVLVDAAAHTSLAIGFSPESDEVLFADTHGSTTADGGLWVVKLPLLAALCKEFGFAEANAPSTQAETCTETV
jgi:hypothetical protein